MERRIDPTDGVTYTIEEFFEYYYASLSRAYLGQQHGFVLACSPCGEVLLG